MSTVQIKLNKSRGQKEEPGLAWIDSRDWDKVVGIRWYFSEVVGVYSRTEGGKQPLMHRVILGLQEKPGIVVRFKDGNRRNCTRANMMAMTKQALAEQVVRENPNAPEGLRKMLLVNQGLAVEAESSVSPEGAEMPSEANGEGHVPEQMPQPSLRHFFEKHTRLDSQSFLWSNDLMELVEEYCLESAIPVFTQGRVYDWLGAVGCSPGMASRKGIRWNGITLVNPAPSPKDLEGTTVATPAEPHPLENSHREVQVIQALIATLYDMAQGEDGKKRVSRILQYVAQHYGVEYRLDFYGRPVNDSK